MRPRLEHVLEESVVAWWRPRMCIKMNLSGNNGYPDRMFLYKGRVLFIEFKALKGHTQFLQEYRHNQLRKEGFQVEVCNEYNHAIRILKDFLEAKGVPEKSHETNAGAGVSGAIP